MPEQMFTSPCRHSIRGPYRGELGRGAVQKRHRAPRWERQGQHRVCLFPQGQVCCVDHYPRHTEITAFLASLCKVCLIIEHGVILPTVNLSVPHPSIRWEEHKMRVPVVPEKLTVRSPSGRALIAMSSSGIGGANGHCVIEGHPSNTDNVSRIWSCEDSMIPSLLIAGGLSPRSASAVGESLKSVAADRDRACIGRALGRRARSMLWKSYSVALSGQIPRFSDPVLSPKVQPNVVFVFSGQGPQHWNSQYNVLIS